VAINAQGTYTNTSPWKIILHTMEGWLDPSTALFRRNGYAPHFGVSLEEDRYVQYNPIDKASSALKNLRGGTETNRDNAIQVEIETNGCAGCVETRAEVRSKFDDVVTHLLVLEAHFGRGGKVEDDRSANYESDEIAMHLAILNKARRFSECVNHVGRAVDEYAVDKKAIDDFVE